MGVHHGWGRTLKDIWQRYHAMQGRDLLLPERLRLPGPVGRGGGREGARPELQARDRGVRARPLRARLPRPRRALRGRADRALEAARPVDGLGPVVLHDDRPQHQLHLGLPEALPRARLALPRPPLDALVPALRHVALPARADRLLQGAHPPVAARAPAARRPRPRVPGGVDDDAVDAAGQRRRRGAPRCRLRARPDARPAWPTSPPTGSRRAPISGTVLGTVRGADLVGLTYTAPFDELPAQEGFENRVVAWEDVSMEEGTGHRPHRPGLRRGGLRARPPRGPGDAHPGRRGRRVHERVRLAARPRSPPRPRRRSSTTSASAARLVADGEITHRYPVCWRCGTELIFRLVDEWFIRCDEIRQPMIEAARGVEWTPPPVRQADGGLARQHGRLVHQPQALLGPAAAVLLLRATAT